MKPLYYELFYVALLLACVAQISAVPALYQTVPPGGVAVCPLSTVQYTCVAQNELQWIAAVVASYTTANQINNMIIAGVFTTVLTDISGTTLTSTATIDSVNLTDDGRSITCREISNGALTELTRTIQVEGVPLAPSSVSIGGILSSTDSELSVNLTWSPSRCVMVYYVEVTATNINFTNTTTSQHITLTLQIGVKYSFRVRGADTINRLGDWSNTFVYTPMPLPTTALPSPTTPPTTNSGQLSGGAIAGIVIGAIVVLILVLVGILILVILLFNKPKHKKTIPLEASKTKPIEASKTKPIEASKTKPIDASKTKPIEAIKTKPIEASKTTGMAPKATDNMTYADLDHSIEGRGKGGRSGTDDKGRKKHPVHYGKIDHDKTKSHAQQTRSAPANSLPATQPNNPKPTGRNPSASSTKK